MTKLETAKGVRDFAPEVKIARQEIVETLKSAFELFGFNPLETPILERYDVMSSKYAGGAEILKETFKLTDQGKRELALRYDLTVPFCRFVGMNPNIKMPFKRYQIGRVFRDGPIKLGRYREFWQCDVDVVGCKKMTADAELIALTDFALKEIGFDFVIRINNRKLLNGIIKEIGVKEKDTESVILTIDKLEKIEKKDVEKELKEKGLNQGQIKQLFMILGKNNFADLKKIINNNEGKEGISELEEVFEYIKEMNIKTAEFDSSLARGLAYYTGTIFEAYLKKSTIKSSIAAGGRYDRMIQEFLQSKQEYPAVGISFGLDVITDAIKAGRKEKAKEKEAKKSIVQVYIVPIGTQKKCFAILNKLRQVGIKADMDLMERGPSKNLNYANAYNIPYVAFVGENELKKGKIKLKDMSSGKEDMLSIDGVIEKFKD